MKLATSEISQHTASTPDLRLAEPFPESAWPLVWQWIEPLLYQVADDFSPRSIGTFVNWALGHQHQWRTWAVYRDEELGGLVITEPVSPCVVQAHVFFKRSFWGSKTTVPMCEQVIEQVFTDDATIKIIGVVFAHNHAIRGILTRLGFEREGLLKSQTLQGGKPVDVVQFGLLKQQWREIHGNLRVQDLEQHQQPEHVQPGAVEPPGSINPELVATH